MRPKITIELEDRKPIKFNFKSKICFIGENGIGKNLCCKLLYKVFNDKEPIKENVDILKKFSLETDSKEYDLTKEVPIEIINQIIELYTDCQNQDYEGFVIKVERAFEQLMKVENYELIDKRTSLPYCDYSNAGNSMNQILRTFKNKINYISNFGSSLHIITKNMIFENWIEKNKTITFYTTHCPECIKPRKTYSDFRDLIKEETLELVSIKWN